MEPSLPSPARVWIDKQTPAVYKALAEVSEAAHAAADQAGLDRKLVELVNFRVSQINGCAFCLDVHERSAVAAGATQQQLAVLPAWRRSELFTPKERAALALAEITTTLPDETTLDREYAFARLHLNDAELSTVVWAATTMNAFNRVSILSRHPVRPRKETAK